MAKVTIAFGVALILLGAWGFISTGNQHPTALIPTYFGLALAWSGILANTENAKRRMLWMHIAVTLGLIGFIGAFARVVVEFKHSQSAPLSAQAAIAVEYQTAMAGICLVFVLLCVRSFIAARSGRTVDAP